MSKLHLDADPHDLAAAQEFLRTGTPEDTINAALRFAAALGARRRDLHRLTSGDLPDLLDPSLMRAAWDR
jgi:hypothetical protein